MTGQGANDDAASAVVRLAVDPTAFLAENIKVTEID